MVVMSSVLTAAFFQAVTMMQQKGESISGGRADAGSSLDRKSTRLNSSHVKRSRMPSSA